MYKQIKNMIKRAFQSAVLDDKGTFSVSQASYLGKTSNYEQIYPYGYSAGAPRGTLILLFDVNGQEQNLAGIPYGSKERFKNLKSGEVIIGSPFKGTSIKFDENGNIIITSPEQDIIIDSAKDVFIKAANDINLESVNDVSITSGNEVSIDSVSTININSQADISINSGSTIDITSTAAMTLTASDLTIENDTVINGNLTVNGEVQDITGKKMSAIITNYNAHTHVSAEPGNPTGTTSNPV